jgi:hypothetical protein
VVACCQIATKAWATSAGSPGNRVFTAQAAGQLFPPLVEQGADPRRAAATQFQAHPFYRRPLATGQHRVCRGKHLAFRYAYRHALPSAILGLIMNDYPTY